MIWLDCEGNLHIFDKDQGSDKGWVSRCGVLLGSGKGCSIKTQGKRKLQPILLSTTVGTLH